MPAPVFYGVDAQGRDIWYVDFVGTGGGVQAQRTLAPLEIFYEYHACSFVDDGTSIPPATTAIKAAQLRLHMTRTAGGPLPYSLGGTFRDSPYDAATGVEAGNWYRTASATHPDGSPGTFVPLNRASDVFDNGLWNWVGYAHNASGLNSYDTDTMTVDSVVLRVYFYYTSSPPSSGKAPMLVVS